MLYFHNFESCLNFDSFSLCINLNFEMKKIFQTELRTFCLEKFWNRILTVSKHFSFILAWDISWKQYFLFIGTVIVSNDCLVLTWKVLLKLTSSGIEGYPFIKDLFEVYHKNHCHSEPICTVILKGASISENLSNHYCYSYIPQCSALDFSGWLFFLC